MEELKEILETQERADRLLNVIKCEQDENAFLDNVKMDVVLYDEHYHVSKISSKKGNIRWGSEEHYDRDEVVVVTHGSIFLYVGDYPVILSAGQSFPLPKNIPHRGTALEDNTEVVIISVPPSQESVRLAQQIKDKQRERKR